MDKPCPPVLYKYEVINKHTLRNLKNTAIYFNKPFNFNDPFDCSFSESSLSYNDDDLIDLFNHLLLIGKISGFEPIEKGTLFPEKLKKAVSQHFVSAVKDIEERQLHKMGCACFSENNNNILMWSHYSDGHKGLCLEFDTTIPLFNHAFPVNYSSEFPTINPIDMLTNANSEIIKREHFLPLLTKYECWKYEDEWRIFHKEPCKVYGYPVEALKAVYFGAAVNKVDLEIVCLILQGHSKNIKYFRARKGTHRYEINFEQYEYTPFTDTVRLEELAQ